MEDGEIDFKEIFFVLKKNVWLILVLFIVLFSGIAYYTFTVSPEFESSAQVMIGVPSVNSVLGTSQVRADVDTQIAIMQSAPIINAGLPVKDILISAVDKSNVIEVKVTAHDPFLAQSSANAVVAAYIEYVVKSKQEGAELVSSFIDTQVQRYTNEIELINKDILVLEQKENLTTVETLSLQSLQQELSAKENLFQELLSKKEEVGIIARENSANVQVIQEAELPEEASSPNILLNLVVGLFLSLGFALFVAYVKEMIRGTVTTVESLEGITGLNVIGDIPKVKDSNSYLIQHNARDGVFSEKIRMLRTNIMFNLQEAHHKLLMVTSASKNDGKTTIAVNLAVSIAHNKQKVLLIDANVRHPKLQEVFKTKSQTKGISEVITSHAKINDGIIKTALKGLDVLFAGSVNNYPGELFTSHEMKELIENVKKKYDIIIIDAPSCEYAETSVLARVTESVLFVVKHDKTKEKAIEQATTHFIKKIKNVYVVRNHV